MAIEENVTFNIDDSLFVLQKIQEEVDSLRALNRGLEDRVQQGEASLKTLTEELQARAALEAGTLQAPSSGLDGEVRKELKTLGSVTAKVQRQLKAETDAMKTWATAHQRKVQEEMEALKAKTALLQPNKLALLCFSGDLDRILAAFMLANGAAAMGMRVMMFFSFWGCTVLRKKKARVKGKDIFGKMFGLMLPKGANQIKLSQMHMGGMGTGMIKFLMKRKNVDSLPEMIRTAEEQGIEIFVCELSMELMGMKRGEIIDYQGLTYAGAAKFLKEAAGTEMNFFI